MGKLAAVCQDGDHVNYLSLVLSYPLYHDVAMLFSLPGTILLWSRATIEVLVPNIGISLDRNHMISYKGYVVRMRIRECDGHLKLGQLVGITQVLASIDFQLYTQACCLPCTNIRAHFESSGTMRVSSTAEKVLVHSY